MLEVSMIQANPNHCLSVWQMAKPSLWSHKRNLKRSPIVQGGPSSHKSVYINYNYIIFPINHRSPSYLRVFTTHWWFHPLGSHNDLGMALASNYPKRSHHRIPRIPISLQERVLTWDLKEQPALFGFVLLTPYGHTFHENKRQLRVPGRIFGWTVRIFGWTVLGKWRQRDMLYISNRLLIYFDALMHDDVYKN